MSCRVSSIDELRAEIPGQRKGKKGFVSVWAGKTLATVVMNRNYKANNPEGKQGRERERRRKERLDCLRDRQTDSLA